MIFGTFQKVWRINSDSYLNCYRDGGGGEHSAKQFIHKPIQECSTHLTHVFPISFPLVHFLFRIYDCYQELLRTDEYIFYQSRCVHYILLYCLLVRMLFKFYLNVGVKKKQRLLIFGT